MRAAWPFIAIAVSSTACPDPPAPLPEDCGPGSVFDGAICVPEACGTGDYGGLDPEGGIYVRAGSDGDGTRDAPFGTITAGLAVANHGDTVVIDIGAYPERLSLERAHDGVTVQGRCRDGVVVEGTGVSAPSISVFASEVVVRELTVRAGRPGVLAGEVPGAPGLVLRANGIVIEDAGGYGLLATGSGVVVDLADVAVRRTYGTNELNPGRGVAVEQGARLVAHDLVVESGSGVGMSVAGVDSRAEVETLSVSGIEPDALSGLGWGLAVSAGATVSVTNAAVSLTTEIGVDVSGALAILELDDAHIGDVRGDSAYALRVRDGGVATVRSSGLRARSGAVRVDGEGSFADLEGVAVEGEADDSPRAALAAHGGGAMRAVTMLIDGDVGVGLLAAGAGSQIVANGLSVRAGEGAPPPDAGVVALDGGSVVGTLLVLLDLAGPGLLASQGGSVRCEDCVIERATGAGAMCGAGGSLDLSGGTIVDSAWDGDAPGVGVLIDGRDGAASASVELARVEGHDGPAIVTRGAVTAELAGNTLGDCGRAGLLPGGVLATDGTSTWTTPSGPGLLLFANRLEQIVNDAVLLDAASATLSGNMFADIGQLELYLQRCEGVPAPVVVEPLSSNDCVGPERIIEPLPAVPEIAIPE